MRVGIRVRGLHLFSQKKMFHSFLIVHSNVITTVFQGSWMISQFYQYFCLIRFSKWCCLCHFWGSKTGFCWGWHGHGGCASGGHRDQCQAGRTVSGRGAWGLFLKCLGPFKQTNRYEQKELVKHAKEKIKKDLQNMFIRDVKSKKIHSGTCCRQGSVLFCWGLGHFSLSMWVQSWQVGQVERIKTHTMAEVSKIWVLKLKFFGFQSRLWPI